MQMDWTISNTISRMKPPRNTVIEFDIEDSFITEPGYELDYNEGNYEDGEPQDVEPIDGAEFYEPEQDQEPVYEVKQYYSPRQSRGYISSTPRAVSYPPVKRTPVVEYYQPVKRTPQQIYKQAIDSPEKLVYTDPKDTPLRMVYEEPTPTPRYSIKRTPVIRNDYKNSPKSSAKPKFRALPVEATVVRSPLPARPRPSLPKRKSLYQPSPIQYVEYEDSQLEYEDMDMNQTPRSTHYNEPGATSPSAGRRSSTVKRRKIATPIPSSPGRRSSISPYQELAMRNAARSKTPLRQEIRREELAAQDPEPLELPEPDNEYDHYELQEDGPAVYEAQEDTHTSNFYDNEHSYESRDNEDTFDTTHEPQDNEATYENNYESRDNEPRYEDNPTVYEEQQPVNEQQEPTSKAKPRKNAKSKATKVTVKAAPKPKEPKGPREQAPRELKQLSTGLRLKEEQVERPQIQDGDIRRSHRTKIAPLQYWKNERVVYGRRESGIHVLSTLRAEEEEPTPLGSRPRVREKVKHEHIVPPEIQVHNYASGKEEYQRIMYLFRNRRDAQYDQCKTSWIE